MTVQHYNFHVPCLLPWQHLSRDSCCTFHCWLHLQFILIYSLVERSHITYKGEPEDEEFPMWADDVGWAMGALALVFIPIIALVEFCKAAGFVKVTRIGPPSAPPRSCLSLNYVFIFFLNFMSSIVHSVFFMSQSYNSIYYLLINTNRLLYLHIFKTFSIVRLWNIINLTKATIIYNNINKRRIMIS